MKDEGKIKGSNISRMQFASAVLPYLFLYKPPLYNFNDGSPNIKTYGSRAYNTYSPAKWKEKKADQGRNELCNCGSGKKYKKCCLRNRTSGE